jgi:hypothetical protein
MSGRTLDSIQRWMQAVIMHPGGVAVAMDAPEARRHVDLPPERLEEVITRSKVLPAAERLGVYATAYYARLLECLREEYAILARTLGEELFDEFAVAYLQRYPSRSYTLNELGRRFPAFLAESCPAEDSEEAPGWTGFLVDLATLEWTYDEVFDGPGVEGQALLTAEALQKVPPERWPEARLVVVPCFRLLDLRYPVHEYYSAVRRGEDVAIPERAETFLAITRRDYVIRRCPLAPAEADLLRALAVKSTIGEALERAAEKAPDLRQLAAGLRGWFARWASEGFFQAVELPD